MVAFHRNPPGMAVGEWFHVHFRRDYKAYVRLGAWSAFLCQPAPAGVCEEER